MKVVSFSLQQGNKYFGQVDDGPQFFIGRRVPYQGNKGLMNTEGSDAQRYKRADFRPTFGIWADFIHPTAMAEGGFYHTLNTYDRARFTFSFLQYAAHVAKGDFVVFVRALLGLEQAGEYFPDLGLVNGRICKIGPNGPQQLESDTSTEGLMAYFNPTLSSVEDTEVIQAARLIHWSQNDPKHRDVQIKVGIDHFRAKMRTYAGWYPFLVGARPEICLMVADIHHQGRAGSGTVRLALQSGDPLAALLEIGAEEYKDRIATLRREIAMLTQSGIFDGLRYDPDHDTFS
ncbi:MAG: hypothetical protein U1E60_29480 [Reyranellaceae bacterium]